MPNNMQELIERVRQLEQTILQHPLCYRFIIEPDDFVVMYPLGYFPEYRRIPKDGCKSRTLAKLILCMEEDWADSAITATCQKELIR